ncbi:MAG: LLM class flavin-dependent oxidoreductase, partial [Candidatus Dormibacteraeota bacterium]|nr:LLM class flavin-dependent oxidoreductase [Candidatus Dormibacteraeota bacterium]
YRFEDVSFQPQRPVPIWVGGEGRAARRRAGRFGDAWFSYYTRISAEDLTLRHEEVRAFAREAGRDPDRVRLTACRPVEMTSAPQPADPTRLRGTPEQLAEALRAYQAAGVDHLALQFMVPRWPDRFDQIERFAAEVMPALRS